MAAAMDALAGFRAAIGATRVVTDAATCALYSQDVYRSGVPALAVLQPQDVTDVLALVRAARTSRTALHVRGGGMSYTDAYLPSESHSVIVDLSALKRIRTLSTVDMTVTAESGCTWAELDAALAPHSLRAKFWGPMSGARATLGGGMSQGAATFGSARHGTSASAALGFEVVLGTGDVGRRVVQALVSRGAGQVAVASRTFENARALAAEFGGACLTWIFLRWIAHFSHLRATEQGVIVK